VKCPFCDSSFDTFRDRAMHLHRSHSWGLRVGGLSFRGPASQPADGPVDLPAVHGKTTRRQWLTALQTKGTK
jgi:hypothetical protein